MSNPNLRRDRAVRRLRVRRDRNRRAPAGGDVGDAPFAAPASGDGIGRGVSTQARRAKPGRTLLDDAHDCRVLGVDKEDLSVT